MNDPTVHRQLIASVASLKSCVRSFVLAVSASPPGAAIKIPSSISRAGDVTSSLHKLLCALSDQTISLPLETSKRLVEVELPDLLQQLLAACSPCCLWPAEGSEQPTAALTHPCWGDAQQLIADVFKILSMLCGVAVRACTRSADPLMVLSQLASPKVMAACTLYMQQLWQAHTDEVPGAATAAAESSLPATDAAATATQAEAAHIAAATAQAAAATDASHAFARVVEAFSSSYSLLAAAVDAQQGLEELELILVSSLCSTNFLPVAVQLLLSASSPACEQSSTHTLKRQCQQAGWNLLTIALFLSGGDIAISPVGPSSVEVRPGQHIPSSVLAAHMRQQAEQPAGTTAVSAEANRSAAIASASMAATEVATGLPLASMQQQLLAPHVLLFLEERLYHAVKEMRVSSDGSSSSLPGSGPSMDCSSTAVAGPAAAASCVPVLLPGRCVPDDQDVLAAALRALRCWRALLVGPAGPSVPLVSSRGVQLLVAVLNGALAESIKDGSSERQALRGRLVRVAVHCLQLLCGCVSQAVLAEQLYGLTAALSRVVSAAGAYWDAHKRAIKSADLPYTGQVRCVDKTTGDMLVRYTMAAQSALLVLSQLVTASNVHLSMLVAQSDGQAESVMVSAGVLPAVEQLFRQVPGVSPAHVAAGDFLVQVLPLSGGDLASGQLSLLATLRKFLVKSAGISEPDRTAAIAMAVKLAEVLGRLASCCAAEPGNQQAGMLLQHAAAQLLPALQVFCASVLKGPVPGPCSCSLAASGIITLTALAAASSAPSPSCHLYPVLLRTYQQLAAVEKVQPGLGLMELLLSSQALQTAAAIVSSKYWASPQVSAVAAHPCNSTLTAQHAVQLVTNLLETVITAVQLPTAAESVAMPLLHASVSDDCLYAGRANSNSTACLIGNLQCGVDGTCSCCSPKACSDVAPATALTADVQLAAATQVAAGQQQQQSVPPLVLLSALLQSKLLTEGQRLLQQLPYPANAAEAGGSFSSTATRQNSSMPNISATHSAPVPVRSSGNMSSKDCSSGRIGGHSPTFSALNPPGIRNQSSGSQQQLLAGYTGSEPSSHTISLISSNAGGSATLRIPSAGQPRFATGIARRGSDGVGPASGSAPGAVAVLGNSPRAVDGDVGGLLRGGSWSSFNAGWIDKASSCSAAAAAAADVLVRDNSGVLSSTASLTSLNRASSSEVGCGASAASDTLPLCWRLQAALLSAGQVVIDAFDSGLQQGGFAGPGAFRGGSMEVFRASSAGGVSAGSSDGGARFVPNSWSAATAQPPVQLEQLRPRSSYSGSTGGYGSPFPPGHDSTVNVIAGLRASLAVAKAATGTVVLVAGAAQDQSARVEVGTVGSPATQQDQQPMSPVEVLEGNSSDMLFPVDLGIAQLQIEQAQAEAAAGVAAVPKRASTPGTVASDCPAPTAVAQQSGSNTYCGVDSTLSGTMLLSDDVLRGVVSGAQAAAPLLARACPPAHDIEQCWHELLGRLHLAPIGCWNVACVNMAGVSEAVQNNRPCANCKVAAFCGKGCEKMAWPSHIVACGKLAAAAARQHV